MFWNVVAVSAFLVVLTFVAAQFVAPLPQFPGGRSLPRMRPAPANVGELFRALGIGSPLWYTCFASAPLFVLTTRRLPLERRHWLASAIVHVALVVLLAVVTTLLQYQLSYGGSDLAPPLMEYVKGATLTAILPFLTVAAIVHAIEARSRAHERSLEAERVRSQLAESRLAALTAQLQPHFLFNTLQGISTLITHDPVAADAMLSSLSDLLREVLRRGDEREVELQEELRVLEPYLDISRRRFGERLKVSLNVDAAALHALVPFFILQPLVENAMHHGISSHAGAGRIDIAAGQSQDVLWLTVSDDGPGIVTSDSRRKIGLANTNERLRELYGEKFTMKAERPANGGYCVTVTLPYHERTSLPNVRAN